MLGATRVYEIGTEAELIIIISSRAERLLPDGNGTVLPRA